jgi:flagellin
MSLRINQNISAMQGHYYMQLNESNFNKEIERLSSGLRINRAADDPAGLVISEKYRAQVDGLQQAINNAKDGIGMVQTAEGALDEATKLLRNMRTLALHAANAGPNDAASVQADQDQISSEIASLTRIAERTKFGSKSLLDGSLGVSGSSSNSNVSFVGATADTKAGTYAVAVTTAAAQGVTKTGALKYTNHSGTAVTAAAAGGTTAGTIAFTSTNIQKDGANLSVTLDVATTDTQATVVNKINQNETLKALGITARVEGTGQTSIKIESDTIGTIGMDITDGTGMDMGANLGIADATTMTQATVDSSNASTKKMGTSENMYFRDTSSTKVATVSISAGQTVSSLVSSLSSGLSSNGINASASFDSSNGLIAITSGQYGSSTNTTLEMKVSKDGTDSNLGLAAATVAGTWYNLANGNTISASGGTAGADIAGTIAGTAATGKGNTLEDTTFGNESYGLKVSAQGTGISSYVTVTKSSLSFQVGAFAGQTVETEINSVKADQLGLGSGTSTASVADINVNTNAGANDAISVLDKAISDLSTMRGKLGSFQKDVLESTVNNLGVAKTNLASSESLIRDADMAQEMLAFSKAQILQQTGMAMLAQANSAPQQIMSLFRG